jgi:hypothetical protein
MGQQEYTLGLSSWVRSKWLCGHRIARKLEKRHADTREVVAGINAGPLTSARRQCGYEMLMATNLPVSMRS